MPWQTDPNSHCSRVLAVLTESYTALRKRDIVEQLGLDENQVHHALQGLRKRKLAMNVGGLGPSAAWVAS